jgi:stage V sporulation protein G
MIGVHRIYKLEKDTSLKAFVDIKICDAVLVKGLRILSKKKGGLFVAMPSQKAEDGKYYETVKMLTKEAKQELQTAVLAAYEA